MSENNPPRESGKRAEKKQHKNVAPQHLPGAPPRASVGLVITQHSQSSAVGPVAGPRAGALLACLVQAAKAVLRAFGAETAQGGLPGGSEV